MHQDAPHPMVDQGRPWATKVGHGRPRSTKANPGRPRSTEADSVQGGGGRGGGEGAPRMPQTPHTRPSREGSTWGATREAGERWGRIHRNPAQLGTGTVTDGETTKVRTAVRTLEESARTCHWSRRSDRSSTLVPCGHGCRHLPAPTNRGGNHGCPSQCGRPHTGGNGP